MSWNPNQGQDPNQPVQPEGYPQQPGQQPGSEPQQGPIKADTSNRAINQVAIHNPTTSKAVLSAVPWLRAINQAATSNKRNMALPILPPIRMVPLPWAWMPMLQRD